MLSATLENINTLLNSKTQLPDSTIITILDLLKHYKVGNWLYPGVFIRKTGLSNKEVFIVLELLRKENLLKQYYELYCPECQKTTSDVFEVFNQIPDTFECSECCHDFDGPQNSYIIYKVISE